MTKRAATVVIIAGLALAAQPVLARGSRGAGGHAGGRSSGPRVSGGGGGRVTGGHAVPRGGGSDVARGPATSRHPSGGYGYYGGRSSGHGYYAGRSSGYGYYGGRSSGYGYYGGRSSGYGRGRYPAYRYGRSYPRYGYSPRYGYRYYPYRGGYYGRSFGLYLGFGGPYAYGSLGWGWPYGYGYGYGGTWPYGYGWGSYGYGATTDVYLTPSDDPAYDDRAPEDPGYADETRGRDVPNTGRVRLEVRPGDATVYVDDEFWGSADESRFLTLRAGRHAIELVRPGFSVVRREVDVAPGETSDVLVELPRP